CLLAVIKSGGAYLPIDSTHPIQRIGYFLENSKTKLVLTDGETRVREIYDGEIIDISLPEIESQPKSNPDTINNLEDLLYVIYTSGSTGMPKGVLVNHKQYINITYAWRKAYRLQEFPVNYLQAASFSVDVFTGDVSRCILNGGKMVICPEN